MSESTGPAHRVKGGTLPPVVLLSAAYVAGIILASQTMIGPVVLVGTLASICAGAAAWTKSTGRTPYLLWCIVGLAAAGSLVFSIETHRLEQGFLLTVSRGQPEVEVVGRILGVPGKSRSGYSFPLAVSQVFKGGRRVVVSDRTWVNSDGREQELTVGQELRLRGRLSPVVFERGEGGFGQYLRRHGIRTTLSTDSKVFELRRGPSPWQALVNAVRATVEGGADRFLAGDNRGIFLGVLIGNTDHISEEMAGSFERTGLTHILAVSGQNVGFVLLMSFVFLGQVRVPRPVRVAVAGLLVLLYMLVTGADPSVMRASVMATIGLLGWLIGRKGQPAALVSVAALAMLVYDPFLLFSVSFQLSFAATIGLICFTGPIVRLLVGVPRGLRELMAVTTAAQIGAGPLVAYYFGQMSVVSLLTNLAVVPVTGLILGIGLVASSVFAVSAVLAGPLYAVLDLLLTYVTGTAGFFGRLPGAVVYIGRFGAASVAVFYSAVVVFFWKVRRVNVVFPTGSIVIGFLAIFVIVLSSSALGAVPGEFTVSFLDLGDGEANLIRGPSGASVLIDGGGPPDVLVRKLRQRGVRQLDLVVVSHPHRDHIEGLARVMQTFPVGLVVEGVDEHDSPDYRQLSAAVRARRIKRRNVASGVRLRLGRIDVHILNPQATPILGTGSDENNNSVVARIDYENISLLFAGDVEAVTERRLVQQHGAGLRATVLKVPHQGSADAADKRFLGAVKARVAVIIVGAGDSYGHPASSTVRNLQRVGARIYRTDRDGDVSLVSDGKDYRILTMGAKKG